MRIINKRYRNLRIDASDIVISDDSKFKHLFKELKDNITFEVLQKELLDFSNDNYEDSFTNYDVLPIESLQDYFKEKNIPILLILIDVIYDNTNIRDRDLVIWDNINGINTNLIAKIKEKEKLLNKKFIKDIEDELEEAYLV